MELLQIALWIVCALGAIIIGTIVGIAVQDKGIRHPYDGPNAWGKKKDTAENEIGPMP